MYKSRSIAAYRARPRSIRSDCAVVAEARTPLGRRAAARSAAFTKRIFDSFGYLSDRIPSKHRGKLELLADEIVDHKVTTIIVIGHAFGSTMERKYTLGFRRALNLSRTLRDFLEKRKTRIEQYPRMLISSFGDTFPRMGTTPAQDRRVDVVFRRRV